MLFIFHNNLVFVFRTFTRLAHKGHRRKALFYNVLKVVRSFLFFPIFVYLILLCFLVVWLLLCCCFVKIVVMSGGLFVLSSADNTCCVFPFANRKSVANEWWGIISALVLMILQTPLFVRMSFAPSIRLSTLLIYSKRKNSSTFFLRHSATLSVLLTTVSLFSIFDGLMLPKHFTFFCFSKLFSGMEELGVTSVEDRLKYGLPANFASGAILVAK